MNKVFVVLYQATSFEDPDSFDQPEAKVVCLTLEKAMEYINKNFVENEDRTFASAVFNASTGMVQCKLYARESTATAQHYFKIDEAPFEG